MEVLQVFQEIRRQDLPKVLVDWLDDIGMEVRETLLDSRNGYYSLELDQFRISLKVENETISIKNVVSLVKDWTVTEVMFKLIISAKYNNIRYIVAELVDKNVGVDYWAKKLDFQQKEGDPSSYVLDIEKLGEFYRNRLLRPEQYFTDVKVLEG